MNKLISYLYTWMLWCMTNHSHEDYFRTLKYCKNNVMLHVRPFFQWQFLTFGDYSYFLSLRLLGLLQDFIPKIKVS